MNALFAQLITALIAEGPDSPDVAKVVTDIQKQFPDQAARVQALLEAWRVSRGQAAPPLTPQSSPPSTSGVMKYLPWVLAALGIGGTAAGGISGIQNLNLDQFKLPQVANPWILLAIVAGVGAIAGLVNSFIRNGGFVLPAFAKDHEKNLLVVTNYGFLGDLFTGAVAAAGITWTAFPTDVRNISTEGTLLHWNVLLSAVFSGWAGARTWCGWRNQNILLAALSETAKQPAVSTLTADKILTAPTIPQAAMMATGKIIPGMSLPPGSPS